MTIDQKNILNLIKRSKPDAGGWYKVSKAVWPIVCNLDDDLALKSETLDGGRLKLTERGQAVVDYL